MKVTFFGSTMLAVLGWQTASAVEVSWYRQPGSAKAIASNAAASVWTIGTDNNLYKWDGKQFVNQNHNYPVTSIAVTTTDKFWLVDQIGLRTPDVLNGYAIYDFQTKARDVAAGGDNSAWIIGTDTRPGGYGVYQYTSSRTFSYANFGAVDVAVDKTGNAWVVNDTGDIHRYNLVSKTWESIPAFSTGAKARSIHTGGSSGAVWAIGTQSVPGGFPIYQWNSSTRAWELYGTYGAVDITEAAYRGSFSQMASCIPKRSR